jgi:archaemetzincin
MRMFILTLVCSMMLITPRSLLAEKAATIMVCIQPLGKYDHKLFGKAIKGLKYMYGFRIKVLDRADMPPQAYYKPRHRYRADKLLDFLEADAMKGTDCSIMVGFTKLDISVTKGKHKDWGIFGLGSSFQHSCVISTFRLGRKTKSARTKIIRTIKVVNHEVGHVLGQGHCESERCLMNDARGKISTVDNETGQLCELCIKEIERRYSIKLPVHDVIDWEQLVD